MAEAEARFELMVTCASTRPAAGDDGWPCIRVPARRPEWIWFDEYESELCTGPRPNTKAESEGAKAPTTPPASTPLLLRQSACAAATVPAPPPVPAQRVEQS